MAVKIAFVIDKIDYKIGGTERQLLLLLDHLDKKEFEPWLCVFRYSSWMEKYKQQYNIHYFNFGSFFSPVSYWNLYKFARWLKKNQFQIVQTQFRDGNIVGILAAKMAGIKTILSSRRNEGYWLNKTELFILKLLNRYVTGYLANSESIKRFVQRVEKIDPKKVKVIYNGVDFSYFDNLDTEYKELRNQFGLQDDDFVITMIANLRPVKRVDVLIDAAAEVVKTNNKAKFLLVGDGEEENNLKTLTKKYGLERQVIFLGKRSDIPQILAVSNLGVLTSASEGLSNAIIEYMGAGLPVICTKVGGNEELVEDGVNGFLIRPGDSKTLSGKIAAFIKQPSLVEKMGQESARKARQLFALDVMIKRTENYYKSLLEQEL
ncbi:MAG TPA: glycosyltransferase [Caldithrix abyssi]|uniref:Glycosyltransferase n=1 Tax=Caldithrix abyssi TaxID=187145 RepID=A0A7V4WVI0_CALAY|nr:glycosyltransferase [Caldithrix abyssi]